MMKPIIDHQLGAQRIGKDESAAKSMLNLLIKHIDDDKKNIQHALVENNLKKLYDANHKLLGALCYCGAPRLEEACLQVQNALKNTDKKNIPKYVNDILHEIEVISSTGRRNANERN